MVIFKIGLHYYSLNGHPSRPENWRFFQRSHVYVALSYIKMFSNSPGVQSCKKYIQIILFYFSAVPKSVPVMALQTKWQPLTAWTLGQRISQSIGGGGGSQHCEVACVLERFYDYVSTVTCGRRAMKITKKMKERNDLHTPIPVSSLTLSSLHSGKYHGESFFCNYLNVWILWLCAFISCSVKVCLNWRRKVNWTFWYQIWVDRG